MLCKAGGSHTVVKALLLPTTSKKKKPGSKKKEGKTLVWKNLGTLVIQRFAFGKNVSKVGGDPLMPRVASGLTSVVRLGAGLA